MVSNAGLKSVSRVEPQSEKIPIFMAVSKGCTPNWI